mmetsp:Transcript_9368/g.17489  ORF Transcript_9368/g.17489 Transcript_9368/m.17489 type:complete len:257 (+) Transcript_9368:24-794(+)
MGIAHAQAFLFIRLGVEHKVVARGFLFLVLHATSLVHSWTEVGWIPPESDIELLQEPIETPNQTHGCPGCALHTRLTLVEHHLVRQRRGHHEIVFYNHCHPTQVVHNPPSNHFGGEHPLFAIQTRTRLIQQVHVGLLGQAHGDRHPLQFTTREVTHVQLPKAWDAERVHHHQAKQPVRARVVGKLLKQELRGAFELPELGRVHLRLVADTKVAEGTLVGLRARAVFVPRVVLTGQEVHEGGLTATVLSEQTNTVVS